MGYAHTPGRRGRKAGLLLAAAGAACAFMAPASADAAFTVPKCGGDGINGAGASFQVLAQNVWKSDSVWKSSDFCGSSAPPVTYFGIGSGGGRQSLANAGNGGARDDGSVGVTAVRFAASDTAVTAAQRTTIENGLATTDTDNAKLHVIPVAVGAITVSVNFPNGCWLDSNDAGFYPSGQVGGADDTSHTGRFSLSKDQLVKAFAADSSMDTWGELLPAIKGVDAGATTTCQNTPITRVVRLDASGTSTVFEKWLNLVKGVSDPTFGGGALGDRTWPNGNNDLNTNGGESATFKRGQGNSGVAAKVNDNDGSIGYIELADARAASFNVVPHAGAAHSFQAPDNDTFWIPMPDGSNVQQEPTANASSYKNGVTGANCATASFGVRPTLGSANTLNLPAAPTGSTDRSLGDDWSLVDGLNPTSGYGLCTPTFELAFDDNADAFGNTDAEQRKARTVKDYLGALVSGQGQAVLNGADYSPLPTTAPAGAPAGTPSLRQVAQDAVAAIDWNKKGVGQNPGGGNPGGGNPGGGNPGGGNPGGGNPGGNPPSNAFSFGSGKSSSAGVITLSLTVPGAGTINATGTTTVPAKFTKVSSAAKKAKKITFGKATVKVSKSGAVKVTLKPSAAAKKALKKGAKLSVSVKITYTPTGGTAKSTTKKITVKGKKPKKK
jgi:ABC-type phosphate transport system substrate-binding protein